MLQKLIWLTLASLAICPARAQEALPPATDWIPSDAFVAIEIRRPEALLELLAGDEMISTITSLPAYRQKEGSKEFQEFLGLITYLEGAFQTDWRSGLELLTGAGITFAICPDDVAVLIVDGKDAAMLERLHGLFVDFARSEAKQEGDPDRVGSKEYRGFTGWSFNGREAHAVVGNRLLLASSEEALKSVIDLCVEHDGGNLTSVAAHQAAVETVAEDAAATIFVNLDRLKRAPKLRRALDDNRKSPLAALMFTGITEAVRESSWLAAGLVAEKDSLVIEATLNGSGADRKGAAAFALPRSQREGILPSLTVPHRIAAFSLFRDLFRFYAAKEELFPERTSELIFFENMMGIFFTGRDLTDEVMAQLGTDIRLVVTEQQYDPEIGTPRVQFPAVAAVFRMREPQAFFEVVQEAWQKALGLINFTRGQEALPGLIIDKEFHGDHKITVAYFSSASVSDRTNLHERFNLRPALALSGEHLILSSTEELTRDLLDALDREAALQGAALAGVDSQVELCGRQLASVLEANRKTLVMKNMIEEGNQLAEAEAAIGLLIDLVRLVDRFAITVGTEQGVTRVRLEAALDFQ